MADLFRLSASEAAARIRDGKLTSEALVRSCLERIDARDSQVKAWVGSIWTAISLCDRDGGRGQTTLSCWNFGNSLPMEVCFLVLEPHFCCQFVLCKLCQILATHTSHLSAQAHGAAL
jgi:hypothetical protein